MPNLELGPYGGQPDGGIASSRLRPRAHEQPLELFPTPRRT